MTDANQLQKAYELIEADKLDEARIILEPIVADDSNNADAWWLYAHAVNEPNAAKTAIQNVLRIDPEYPEAASLLNMLNQEPTSESQPVTLTQPPLKGIKSIGSTSAASSPVVAADDDTPDFSDDDEDIDFDDALPDEGDESKPGFRLPAPVLGIILVVAIIIIGLVIVAILNPAGTPPSDAVGTTVASGTEAPTMEEVAEEPSSTPEESMAEPTQSAEETEISGDNQSAPTPEEAGGSETPTPTEEVMVTEEGGSSETSSADAQAALVEALGAFTLGETPIETTETDLGNTVMVNICSTPEDLRTTAVGAMEVIAENSDTFAGVDAFAVSISACDAGTPLRTLGVTLQDALDYASGSLSASEFQAKWQPLG